MELATIAPLRQILIFPGHTMPAYPYFWPALLLLAACVIIGLLGAAHLWLTFHGPALAPRDPAVLQAMQSDAPGISRQTTLWRAWLGFNASHSLGALLFALVWGYFALVLTPVFFSSWFLRGLGLLVLLCYLWLARRYWFRVPQRGISLALLLYLASCVLAANP